MTDLSTFRTETRAWLEENCPQEMRNLSFHWEDAHLIYSTEAAEVWRKRMADKGWIAPMWPSAYGGGGLSREEAIVLSQEMGRIKATAASSGMGLTMIGPTLLEFGTEDQKRRHLPSITDGSIRWCQGYSEPGGRLRLGGAADASCDRRRSLYKSMAKKVWTSGAQHADWMFALVRTDPSAAKHEGISFVLLDMHQAGVTVKPIGLISGSSPFCETFLDNATAHRADLVGELNKGWTIGKRLLQFERSGIGGLSGAANKKKAVKTNPLVDIAKRYVGDHDGKISDSEYREKVLKHSMTERAFQLTTSRVVQENQSGQTPGATTSIFKLVGSTLARDGAALKSELMGGARTGLGRRRL